jgi:arsenate reductase (glutaredoxin)
MTITIYHNPRCSKSRQTLALLQERGITPNVKEYLTDVPSAEELKNMLDMLKLKPRDLMHKNEPDYIENGLNDPALNDEALIKAMVTHPKLIERPIVINGKKAAIGRPPESVLEIL